MREIKFRAWCPQIKIMGIVESINWLSNAVWIKETKLARNLSEEDCILLQFTGLKDKNGKEIYEGDLLNSLYRKDGCKGIYEIRWNKGSFRIVRHGEHQQINVIITYDCLSRCEIIGNIYENPELLK